MASLATANGGQQRKWLPVFTRRGNCDASSTHARTHTHTHIHAHARTYTHTHTHTHARTHIYTHTYTRTHAHTHTHAIPRACTLVRTRMRKSSSACDEKITRILYYDIIEHRRLNYANISYHSLHRMPRLQTDVLYTKQTQLS